MAAGLAAALGACGSYDATGACTNTLAVAPAVLPLAIGAQGRVAAMGAAQLGTCRSVPAAVRWDVQDSTVATVRADTGSTALVTGRASGNTFVIATFLADTTLRAGAVVEVGTGGPPGQQ